MCVHREDDREDDGHGDFRGGGECVVLEDDDGEDERGQSAWAEPADEREGPRPGMGTEEGDGYRQHAHEGEAENAVCCGAPGEVGECRPDDRGAEDEEGRAVCELPELVEEVCRVSFGVTVECPEDEPADEGGDEAA